MKKKAIASIFESTVMILSTLLFLYLGYGISSVIISIVISTALPCIYLAGVLKNYFIMIPLSVFFAYSKKLLIFEFQTLIADSLIAINYQTDTLMVGYFFTEYDVGLYYVAIIFAKLLWLVPDSIQTISYPTTSKYYGEGKRFS